MSAKIADRRCEIRFCFIMRYIGIIEFGRLNGGRAGWQGRSFVRLNSYPQQGQTFQRTSDLLSARFLHSKPLVSLSLYVPFIMLSLKICCPLIHRMLLSSAPLLPPIQLRIWRFALVGFLSGYRRLSGRVGRAMKRVSRRETFLSD